MFSANTTQIDWWDIQWAHFDKKNLILNLRTQNNFMNIAENINTTNTDPNMNWFYLAWISGHSGVKGNEKVDKEAKRAAWGDSSPQHMLLPILRRQLLRSWAALNQKHHKELKEKWKDMWSASPCQPKLTQLNPKFTYKCYSKIQTNLKRYQVNLLTQIHTGHIPLNFYLHQIKKAESSNCTVCQGHGLPTKETIMHFLFECSTFNKEQHELDKQTGKDSRDLPTLLSSKKGVKALVQWLTDTWIHRH